MHNCHPIDVILEKRCIKFVWSLYNNNYALYSNTLRFSLQNGNSTLGKNVRYLMHKYDIVNSDWTQTIDIVAEGQGNTVGLIVVVYSDQISTILSNKIR